MQRQASFSCTTSATTRRSPRPPIDVPARTAHGIADHGDGDRAAIAAFLTTVVTGDTGHMWYLIAGIAVAAALLSLAFIRTEARTSHRRS